MLQIHPEDPEVFGFSDTDQKNQIRILSERNFVQNHQKINLNFMREDFLCWYKSAIWQNSVLIRYDLKYRATSSIGIKIYNKNYWHFSILGPIQARSVCRILPTGSGIWCQIGWIRNTGLQGIAWKRASIKGIFFVWTSNFISMLLIASPSTGQFSNILRLTLRNSVITNWIGSVHFRPKGVPSLPSMWSKDRCPRWSIPPASAIAVTKQNKDEPSIRAINWIV